jgi:aminodeoxyfutalosine deaminase
VGVPDEPYVIAADAVIAFHEAYPRVWRQAGVVVEGERVVMAGELAEIRGRFGELPLRRHHGLLLPGFVNAHTHLDRSNESAEQLKSDSLPEWITRLITTFPAPEQLETAVRSAVRRGIVESLHAGVTTVGDIARNVEPARREFAASGSPAAPSPRIVSFGEVMGLGKMRQRAPGLIAAAAAGADRLSPAGLPLLRRGISPHAPYTVEGPTLRACVRQAILMNLPIVMHLAESADEAVFLKNMSGPLGWEWEVMRERNVLDEHMPRMRGGPIRWAQYWGLILADVHETKPRSFPVLLAHVNYCDPGELSQLSASRASVAYCPRTHAYFGHPPHRYREMLDASINVCLATDSRASNPDLSLLKEARLVFERDGTDPYVLLEMITRRGALALGLQDHLGTIAPGQAADFTLLPWTGEGEPAEWAVRIAPEPAAVWLGGRRVV